MLTVGNQLAPFRVTGIKPSFTQPEQSGESAFETITETSFPGKWKVIYFFPKVATFVCPTEIVAYDKLVGEFADRDAILLGGSTDNEFTHVAWRQNHADLAKTAHWSFADTRRDELSLAGQLGILTEEGVALRATFIVDPDNVIQHVTVNNLNVGRNSMEALRVLDSIQTDELCPCNRRVGGDTL